MRKAIGGLALAGVLGLSVACQTGGESGGPANTPGGATNTAAPGTTPGGAPKAPTFAPGSPEFIVANQPDFKADAIAETSMGKVGGLMAKKGDNSRVEVTLPTGAKEILPGVTKLTTIIRKGQPALMLLPDKKEYIEWPADQVFGPVETLGGVIAKLQREGYKLQAAGDEVVDGHPTTKIKITKDGQEGEAFAYAAKDLKDLIIKFETAVGGAKSTVTLSKISMEVGDDLFAPPADYKKGNASDYGAPMTSEQAPTEGSVTSGTPAPATTAGGAPKGAPAGTPAAPAAPAAPK